jgi:hypothetical protein
MYLVVGESIGAWPVSLRVYPPAHSDTYVKATSKRTTTHWPYYATDPTKSLTGTTATNWWSSAEGTVTNQRFHIDLGSAKVIRGIYYENMHFGGASTNEGSKNFIMQGSAESTAFAELTYATDTDWTQIGGAMQFEEHTASDVADPKYIAITNSTAYRYIALKIADNWGSALCMGLRRIVLLTDEGFVHCSGHCQDDFGDIRFHDSTDAALAYMIDWGSLTGTTPNQSVGVWVATDPETSATDVVIKYGDATLTDASDGAAVFIKYKPFESGSDGNSIATADEDWTVGSGTVEIDTAQKHLGTRSMKLVGAATGPGAALPLTAASNSYMISVWARKTDKAGKFYPLLHGNGTKRIAVFCDSSENIQYRRGDDTWIDTGVNCTIDTWQLYEARNIDFSAGTFDLWFEGVCIVTGAELNTSAEEQDVLRFYCDGAGTGADSWIDDLIVRKYASPEPTWGAWGAEVEIDNSTELVVADSSHAIGSDSVNLIPDSELTVADASSTMSAENLILYLAGQLVVAGSSSASTSDNIDLTQVHVLAVGDSSSALSSEEPVASFDLALVVGDSLHANESDNVVFFQARTLELSDSILSFEVDEELILAELWTVPDGVHARLFGDLELLLFSGSLELLSFGGSLELLSFSGSLE